MGNAIGYLRVSTDEQSLGADAQRAAIESWASRNGVVIATWCADLGVSGAAPLERRPGLMQAIDALKEHGASLLLVAKRDRLARDVVGAAMIERLVVRCGSKVVSAAGEGTDNDDPSSQLMRTMVDAFAQYERAIIRARTKSALAVKKSRGERVGTVSYGYQLSADGLSLEPCEAEQAVIAQVKVARTAGLSLRAIVAELERAGIVGRTGKALALTQVAHIASAA